MMFIKIFQRPNIHRSNITNDSVTQTSFFLTRPLIINNFTETAIHCYRYVTYQITWLQKQFILDTFINYIRKDTRDLYLEKCIFRSVYLKKFAMQ